MRLSAKAGNAFTRCANPSLLNRSNGIGSRIRTCSKGEISSAAQYRGVRHSSMNLLPTRSFNSPHPLISVGMKSEKRRKLSGTMGAMFALRIAIEKLPSCRRRNEKLSAPTGMSGTPSTEVARATVARIFNWGSRHPGYR